MNKLIAVMLLAGSLALVSAHIGAAEPHSAHQPRQTPPGIELSADVLELLRAEMREITVGVQSIPAALAGADWHAIEETGGKIRDSYIMNRKLSKAQAQELEHALPEQFKHLDAEFHRRAGRLSAAAAARDYERVVFEYSRLVEACAQCHSRFAGARFPGFETAAPPAHKH